MPDPTHLSTEELDALESLPPRHLRSTILVLAVQALNFFNDNLAKMLLISLAIAVAKGTELGDNMQVHLGMIFALPYILFAPLAGYLSDRFSKQRVVFWMQVAQVLILLGIIGAISLRQPQLSLMLALGGFSVLATEATLFSPAKMGIMKDLVGSRRLGTASGLLQMSMMAAILVGMWAGGTWYGARLEATGDKWGSCLVPLSVVTGLALLQIVGAFFVQPTPGHPHVKFRRETLWEHFPQATSLFTNPAIRDAVIGKVYFWFVSQALIGSLVYLSAEMHPGDPAKISRTLSLFPAALGVGMMFGSLLASVLSRKQINLRIVPIAGFVMTAGLFFAGTGPALDGPVLGALLVVGGAGGCFMVPLYAFVQDRSRPDERARVLAGINLLDSLCGLVAMGAVWVLHRCHLSAQAQLTVFSLLTLAAAIFTLRFFRAGAARPAA